MKLSIRKFKERDLKPIKAITVGGFVGVSLDYLLEQKLGDDFAGHDWRWRKSRHVDDDLETNPEGIFVVEGEDGVILGCISAKVDREAGKGRMPNLAVASKARSQVIGHALVECVRDYFRREKLEYAVIETMESNPIGQTLYRQTGFREIARQVHYARKL